MSATVSPAPSLPSTAAAASPLSPALRAVQHLPRSLIACCVASLVLGFGAMLETGAAVAKGTDYFYYYCVSRLVNSGQGGQIYDLNKLGLLERSLAAPVRVPGGVIPNVYPPFFALLTAPLAALPYSTGYVFWLALNCVVFGAALAFALHSSELRGRARFGFGAIALLSLPALIALLQGQVSMVLLGLFVLTYRAARSGHDTVAGAALAFTLIKPQYVIPFLLLFALMRRSRILAAFGVTAALLVLAPLPILGAGVVGGYAHSLVDATHWGAQVGGFAPRWNRSFAGFTQLLFPSGVATSVALGLDILTLGLLVRIVRLRRSFELSFAACVVAALLISQHVLIHDLVLLLLPVTVLIANRRAAATPAVPLALAAYAAVAAGFWLAPVIHIQLATVAMCALGAALLSVRREPSSAEAST
jgi:hypothetical protein